MTGYKIAEKRKGRRLYSLFALFNTLSFTLILGNVLILYLIRLNASGAMIGLITSLNYVAFFLIPIGKKILPKTGVTKIMGWTWVLRYTFSIPILLSSYLAYHDKTNAALISLFISLLLFHIVRGVGMVGYNPLTREISAGKDRGKFLSSLQLIIHFVVLFSSLSIAFILKPGSPLFIFTILFGIGIISGYTGSVFLFYIPEPAGGKDGASDKIITSVKAAWKNPSFRRFVPAFATFLFASAMIRPFIMVYAKQIFELSDQMAMLLSIAGNIGAISMALIAGLFLDRIGSKPLIIIFLLICGISIIPGIISPVLSTAGIFVLIGLMFFFFNMGAAGTETGCQSYFFSIVSQRDQVNLGMIYFLIMGITGALGSNIGGLFLDLLRFLLPDNPRLVFQLFFTAAAVLSGIAFIIMGRIESLGAHTVPKALGLMFSVKDLRAITLLNKLDNTSSIEEERKVIRDIGTAQSAFPQKEIIKKLSSPSFAIRSEALYALAKMPVTENIQEALLDQLKSFHFTTASIAARICGQKRIKAAIPLLRDSLHSSDYLLVSKAILALGRLDDQESLERIEEIITTSENPHILNHGISALNIISDKRSIKVLLSVLARQHVPSFIREEIYFVLTDLLKFKKWFYPFYTVFRESNEAGIDLLIDQLEKKHAPRGMDFDFIMQENFGTPEFLGKTAEALKTMSIDPVLEESLISALENKALSKYRGFCFLIAAFIVYNSTLKKSANGNALSFKDRPYPPDPGGR